jgi:uncharacterized PurR-regulated membrane protein YhhQ (DUF165 family)
MLKIANNILIIICATGSGLAHLISSFNDVFVQHFLRFVPLVIFVPKVFAYQVDAYRAFATG